MHFSIRNTPENDLKMPNVIFDWLKKELTHAQIHNLKVILVYHMPHGVLSTAIVVESFWVKEYNDTMMSFYKQFNGIISAVITGHIHVSGLNVSSYEYYLLKDLNYYGGDIINRAVSPNYENSPGFTVINFPIELSHPKNFYEYTFMIDNTYNKKDPPEKYWQYLYDSRKDLNITKLNPTGIAAFLTALETDRKLYIKYILYNIIFVSRINFFSYV